jgi:hypothetical protein
MSAKSFAPLSFAVRTHCSSSAWMCTKAARVDGGGEKRSSAMTGALCPCVTMLRSRSIAMDTVTGECHP